MNTLEAHYRLKYTSVTFLLKIYLHGSKHQLLFCLLYRKTNEIDTNITTIIFIQLNQTGLHYEKNIV